MKKSILIAGLLMIGNGVFAYSSTLIDSVGVEKINGKSYIIHSVDEKETLFAISRRYKTPVNEIVQNNEDLKQGLKMGQRIRVPFVETSAIPTGAKLHNVAPGETLFSIAKTYQIAVQDLMTWNDLKGNDLSVGQALIIEGKADPKPDGTASAPTTAEAAPVTKSAPNKKVTETRPSSTPKSTTVLTSGGWITHKVEQGQTLFSIARQYDAKVENLVEWNGLSSNNLALGQSLKVGRDTVSTVPTVTSSPPASKNTPASTGPPPSVPAKPTGSSTGSSSASTPSVRVPSEEAASSSTAYKNIKEVGQAEVIEGTGNHKKYLVLHRTAPVGTIMRIRNEENDITVFARVVGVLPDTGNNNKLIIKVSKAAFDQLKAVNSKFPVEVSY